MIETYFGDIFTEVVLAIILGVGGLIVGYFRKISKTQTDLCNKVANLEKALVILCTALDGRLTGFIMTKSLIVIYKTSCVRS